METSSGTLPLALVSFLTMGRICLKCHITVGDTTHVLADISVILQCSVDGLIDTAV